MTNGLLVYEEIFAHFIIYYCPTPNCLIYEENLIFFFISVAVVTGVVVGEMYLRSDGKWGYGGMGWLVGKY
jgi:hypothetical protein